MTDEPFRVFVGWDPSEAEAAEVLEYTLLKHTSVPLDIRMLKRHELVQYHKFRLGANRMGATEFSFARFAVPYLCDYEGIALFMDCDMICLGDISPLSQIDMTNYAIGCVKHNFVPTTETKMYGAPQQAYPRKLWSAFMLLDCAKLKHWTKSIVEEASGAYLHRFMDIPDGRILGLGYEWQEVEKIRPETKIFHYTEFNPCHNPGVHPEEHAYLKAREEMRLTPVKV